MERKWSISTSQHASKQRSWTSHSHFQGTIYCHTRRSCSIFPRKFVGTLNPSNRTNPQLYPASNPQPFQISMGILPRPIQLRRYTTRTPWLRHHRTQKDQDKALMGLLWCILLECLCSAPKLPVPHHCSKSHPSGPSLRHSGIQKPKPHTADSHTNGPHCTRRIHTNMQLTQRLYYCMWQSTCCNTRAPPGYRMMGQTNTACTEEDAYYHSSIYAQKTPFYTVPHVTYQRRPNPRCTSKGGHSEV